MDQDGDGEISLDELEFFVSRIKDEISSDNSTDCTKVKDLLNKRFFKKQTIKPHLDIGQAVSASPVGSNYCDCLVSPNVIVTKLSSILLFFYNK
jgi:hypothetical protein